MTEAAYSKTDYTLEVTTSPTIPADWLAKAKHQIRVEAEETYDNVFIQGLLLDAVEYIGDRCDISILPTVYKLTLSRFPQRHRSTIYLPRLPLVSVDAITYIDADGATQTLATTRATLGHLSMISMPVDESWPTVEDRIDSVVIDYTSGSTTPRAAYRAVMLLVGHWYEQREDTTEVRLESIPHGVDALCEHLRPGDDFRRPIQEPE